jgi:hypothetical protein
LGVPTVVFTTTKFELLTNKVAANFGLADARVVVVDHPLGGTDEETICRWADAAADAVIARLTRQGA